mmetsp:Transcript_51287/g.94815  ORF Transcript_51287/g.94815 Transcript_51287/m.94815 type:complete len:319 (+) Transcript_51287:89-1045(+)
MSFIKDQLDWMKILKDHTIWSAMAQALLGDHTRVDEVRARVVYHVSDPNACKTYDYKNIVLQLLGMDLESYQEKVGEGEPLGNGFTIAAVSRAYRRTIELSLDGFTYLCLDRSVEYVNEGPVRLAGFRIDGIDEIFYRPLSQPSPYQWFQPHQAPAAPDGCHFLYCPRCSCKKGCREACQEDPAGICNYHPVGLCKYRYSCKFHHIARGRCRHATGCAERQKQIQLVVQAGGLEWVGLFPLEREAMPETASEEEMQRNAVTVVEAMTELGLPHHQYDYFDSLTRTEVEPIAPLRKAVREFQGAGPIEVYRMIAVRSES